MKSIKLSKEILEKFFKYNPYLSMRQISLEAGLDHSTVYQIIKKNRTINPSVEKKLMPILIKYQLNEILKNNP